jgi:hypothetical protein
MPLSGLPGRTAIGPRHFAALLAAWLLGAAAPLAAQPVGDVIYVHGIASAQQPGQAPRFIQKGDPINEGEVINTGGRGFAVIQLKDGTKMTLRPDTTFVVDQHRQGGREESLLLRLAKGGMRTVTGLIAKRNPQAMRINAGTATIGIRGTSFDARLCGAECAQEAGAAQKPPAAAPAEAIVARVALVSGNASIVGGDGQARPAAKGTALQSGEMVRTQKDSWAVVAFRDQSVVTVAAESEFRLENVRIGLQPAATDSFVVRILKGGARSLTGLIAKRQPAAVRINIGTATIGIRGTGVDGRIAADCVAGSCTDAAFAHTWEGEVSLEAQGRSILIGKDRAGVHNPARNRLELLERVPEFFTVETSPRPDSLKIDFDNLFGAAALDGQPAGLYVAMRDGHIELAGPNGAVDLGPGETGYFGEGALVPVRLARTPEFLLLDPFPQPDKFDETTIRLLDVLNPGGSPGDTICEM